LYSFLSPEEWDILRAWYQDTEEKEMIGEMGVPLASLLQGFIMGSGVHRIVQCGHYSGYSTLLLGFMLRHMGRTASLYSIDIDPYVTAYTQGWVDRAGLNDIVHLEIADSSDPSLPAKAREYLGGDLQVIVVDSSHQYAHTFAELELWYDALTPLGVMFLHDISDFARSFDATGGGGVKQALEEWAPRRAISLCSLNSDIGPKSTGILPIYGDGCGVGILQKRVAA
jgi:predicted O-methyltransferase YrrM